MHRLFNLIVVTALFALLTACDKPSAPTAATPAAPPPLPELRLGYFANVTHAQAVLGVASGDFQTALGTDTKLTPKVFNAGPDLIQAINAGAIDIAYVGPGPVIIAQGNSNGQAVRVISGSAANGVAIVARQGSGISTIKDLVGKKIATPQHGNTQDVAARHYLTAVLGQTDTENVLPIPNLQQVSLMAIGKIDAAWAARAVGLAPDRRRPRHARRRRKRSLAQPSIRAHGRRHASRFPARSQRHRR